MRIPSDRSGSSGHGAPPRLLRLAAGVLALGLALGCAHGPAGSSARHGALRAHELDGVDPWKKPDANGVLITEFPMVDDAEGKSLNYKKVYDDDDEDVQPPRMRRKYYDDVKVEPADPALSPGAPGKRLIRLKSPFTDKMHEGRYELDLYPLLPTKFFDSRARFRWDWLVTDLPPAPAGCKANALIVEIICHLAYTGGKNSFAQLRYHFGGNGADPAGPDQPPRNCGSRPVDGDTVYSGEFYLRAAPACGVAPPARTPGSPSPAPAVMLHEDRNLFADCAAVVAGAGLQAPQSQDSPDGVVRPDALDSLTLEARVGMHQLAVGYVDKLQVGYHTQPTPTPEPTSLTAAFPAPALAAPAPTGFRAAESASREKPRRPPVEDQLLDDDDNPISARR